MRENWEIHWKDYYNILQIHPLAEPEVVKAAYDKLARKYHPDMNQSQTTEKMKDLNEAYEILSNPEKRERYYEAYRKRVYVKSESTNPPPKPEPKTTPPKEKTTTKSKPHDSKPRNKTKGWGNIHEPGKYAKKPLDNLNPLGNPDLYKPVKDDAFTVIIRIIFALIGLFAIVAPWFQYATTQSIIWLVVSIILSIIFLPITLVIAFSFKKK